MKPSPNRSRKNANRSAGTNGSPSKRNPRTRRPWAQRRATASRSRSPQSIVRLRDGLTGMGNDGWDSTGATTTGSTAMARAKPPEKQARPSAAGRQPARLDDSSPAVRGVFFHAGHVRAGVLDDAEELVSHPPALGGGRHRPVWPQVAAADARAQHAHHASVGSVSVGSGTFSTRTSPAPYITHHPTPVPKAPTD